MISCHFPAFFYGAITDDVVILDVMVEKKNPKKWHEFIKFVVL